MRAALLILIAVSSLLCACHRQSGPDRIADIYGNRANAIDNEAEQQPNPVAKTIYHSRADAVRAEGEERKAGLEKAGADAAPPIPAPPAN